MSEETREGVAAQFREIGRLVNAIAEERRATLAAFSKALAESFREAAKRR